MGLETHTFDSEAAVSLAVICIMLRGAEITIIPCALMENMFEKLTAFFFSFAERVFARVERAWNNKYTLVEFLLKFIIFVLWKLNRSL